MRQKIFPLLFLTAVFAAAPGCTFFHSKSGAQSSKQQNTATGQYSSKDYREPKRIGTIQDDAITESSGIAASHRNKDIFWTHNDSGDGAFLYAFDRTGKKRGVWKVEAAKSVDWEDIAAYKDKQTGVNYLFIGDIGNNSKNRTELTIYRIIEPETKSEDATSTKKNPRLTSRAEAIRVSYPNARHDAETLLVSPENGDLYIVSKNFSGNADIYKLAAPFDFDRLQNLEHIGQIGVPSATRGFLTGGDISPDGKRLILCDYFAAYEIVLPATAKNFDEIWKQSASAVNLGERAQGEAVCYRTDGRAVLATSEKKNSPLIEAERK